jgi:acyl carrier protein
MSLQDCASIRKFILSHAAERYGSVLPENVPDSYDLLEHGVIDSLGLIDLIAALEKLTGIEIDLSSMPPEELTVIGPLSSFLESAIAKR